MLTQIAEIAGLVLADEMAGSFEMARIGATLDEVRDCALHQSRHTECTFEIGLEEAAGSTPAKSIARRQGL